MDAEDGLVQGVAWDPKCFEFFPGILCSKHFCMLMNEMRIYIYVFFIVLLHFVNHLNGPPYTHTFSRWMGLRVML